MKKVLLVISATRIYEYSNAMFDINAEGMLYIQKQSGPDGKGKKETVAIYNANYGWECVVVADAVDAIEEVGKYAKGFVVE